MTDKKITELNALTGANLNNSDEFVVVDISADETKAITAGQLKTVFLPIAGGTMTGDLNFGDGDSIKLGTGGDFDIYHTGANTLMDNLTGSVYIRNYADNAAVNIQSDDGAGGIATYFQAKGSSGEAALFHYGAEKLATKATGVDVTGNVTATGALIGHDSARNTANATLGAAMGLGKVFWMDGLPYINETGGTAGTDLGVSNINPYGQVTPEHFGAVGGGATDDCDAIQAGLDYLLASGGGIMDGRGFTYKVDAVRVCDANNRLGNLKLHDGIFLDNMKIARGTVANSSRAIVWPQKDTTSGGILNCEIDANDAAISSPTVHGIFSNSSLTNFRIEDNTIRNTSAYGIGLQDTDTAAIADELLVVGQTYMIEALGNTDWNAVAGTVGVTYAVDNYFEVVAAGSGTGTASFVGATRNCRVVGNTLLNIGNDGLDIKDRSALTGNNIVSGNVVDGWGMNPDLDPDKVGLQSRGQGNTVSDNRCINPGPSAGTGIKVDTINPTPVTAEYTVMSNNFVDTRGQDDVDSYSLRINRINFTGNMGVVGNLSIGIIIAGNVSEVNITSPMLYGEAGSLHGIITGTIDDTDIHITGGSVDGFINNYNIRSENTHLVDCHSKASTAAGVTVAAGVTKFTMRGGSVAIASGAKITDSSGIAVIDGVQGYKNTAKLSDTFDISSTGVKTMTIAHGLDVTPAISDCLVTLGVKTADAFTLHWPALVQTTNATNITIDVRVSVASGTAGKTATAIAHINAVKPTT